MPHVLVAIALLALVQGRVRLLLGFLFVCSTAWANGGSTAEVITAGLLGWTIMATARRLRRRHRSRVS